MALVVAGDKAPSVFKLGASCSSTSLVIKNIVQNALIHSDYWQLLVSCLNKMRSGGGYCKIEAKCGDAVPDKSGYRGRNDFPTRQSVLEKAYDDAVTIAREAAGVANDSLG